VRNLADFHFGRGVKVYRGLSNTTPEEVDLNDVGLHWSQNRQSAEDFVTGVQRDRAGNPDSQLAGRDSTGVVLEGRVNKKHTSKPDTFASEKETTVAPGATVKVKKIHTIAVNKSENDFNTASVVGSKRVNKKAKVIERPRESYKKKQ
jgi:hypothetical protein